MVTGSDVPAQSQVPLPVVEKHSSPEVLAGHRPF
jgi:hypothetical protein